MKFCLPVLTSKQWLTIIVSTILGALVMGGYGALHNQLTFSIAPEYFTLVKFRQFSVANWEISDRWRAALIGFQSIWALGAAVGLIFSRMVIVSFTKVDGCRKFGIAFGIMMGTMILFGVGGWLLSPLWASLERAEADPRWADYAVVYNLPNFEAFVHAAQIHCASFYGTALGVFLGVAYLTVLILRKGPRST